MNKEIAKIIHGSKSSSLNQIKSTIQKKKILAWTDTPTVSTGFGIVARYVLKGLYETGKYDIDVLGVNFNGDFYNKDDFPYQIIPARAQDPNDIYGYGLFLSTVKNKDYDFIFIQNDTFVVHQAVEKLQEIRHDKALAKEKVPKVVFYYPIDCRAFPDMSGMIAAADMAVAYSDFAIEATKKVLPNTNIQRIYLGVNPQVFKPLLPAQKRHFRREYFKVEDDETFIFINVNRNSARKDVAKTIYAFNEFNKIHPNSILYLHMAPRDQGAGSMMVTDLTVPVNHLGMANTGKVRFPANFNPAIGYPEVVLNQLLNCSNAYITTHLGEGFGLSILEAASAGLPLILPNNTVTPELFGEDREKAYIYPCIEPVYIDSSGFRMSGRIEDILCSMLACYEERNNNTELCYRARQFAESLSWKNINQQWTDLFERLDKQEPNIKQDFTGTVL